MSRPLLFRRTSLNRLLSHAKLSKIFHEFGSFDAPYLAVAFDTLMIVSNRAPFSTTFSYSTTDERDVQHPFFVFANDLET